MDSIFMGVITKKITVITAVFKLKLCKIPRFSFLTTKEKQSKYMPKRRCTFSEIIEKKCLVIPKKTDKISG